MVWQQGQPLKQGHYDIQRVISMGGHSITYLATTSAGEQVVIKTWLDEWVSDLRLQRLFRDEAQVLSLCRHDHVVRPVLYCAAPNYLRMVLMPWKE